MKGKRRHFGSLVAKPHIPPNPFLKWAGGKTQLLDQMEEWFPDDYDVYLEPFLGGGAVFFRLMPERAILGDSNRELINAYGVVQSDVRLLMKKLDGHKPRATDREYFYRMRAQNPNRLNEILRAARTIFLNKTCFNGLFRVNSKGEFNVPFGRYVKPQLYDDENLIACSHALSGMILDSLDYEDLLAYARSGDFIYLDPPYQPLTKTANFTSYTKDAFSEKDQRNLALIFSDLDDRGCKVMLSNSATKLIRELYSDYEIRILRARRSISSKAQTRGKIDELLIMNYEV